MEIRLLHQQSVPCSANIEKDRSEKRGDDIRYYLNPSALLRYEPEGSVIIPQKLEHSFIFADKELSVLLRNRSFSGRELPSSSIESLVSYGIISEKRFENKNYREYFVNKSNLPIHALFDVTTKCDCNCVMCYHKEDLSGYEPPLKDILKRLEDLKKLGIQSIEFTGGEVLLREDIYDILKKAVNLDLNFYLMTNGEYLQNMNEEVINLLKDKDHSLGVIVSLDAVGNAHDIIRKRPGLYKKIIKGLDLIHANQIDIELVATIFRDNVGYMQQIISVAKKYNTNVQFRPSINTGAAKINNIQGISLTEDILMHLKDKNVINNFIGTRKEIVSSQYYGCNSMIKISVDVNGNVLPCVMDRKRMLGNIANYTQEELRKDMLKEINHFLSEHKKCRTCEINAEKIKCSGFCRFSKSYKHN